MKAAARLEGRAVAVLGERRLDLVEIVADALAEHADGLAARLLDQAGELTQTLERGLEGLLGELGLADQTVLGAALGGQLAGDLGEVLDALADDLGLAADDRLDALEGDLVGGGQRLDV